MSNHDPLDLIKAEFVAVAVVELRRARRCLVRHGRCLFWRAAILEIGGDPGRPETAIAELRSSNAAAGRFVTATSSSGRPVAIPDHEHERPNAGKWRR